MSEKKKRSPAPASGAAAEWVPERDLELWDKNPRANDGEPVRKVVESIKRFGFVSPLVVWTSKRQLVAGHTRLKALREILAVEPTFVPKGAPGVGLVPVRFHEFKDDAEAAAYAIADNRLVLEADWDYEKLVSLLNDVKDTDIDLLLLTGFDASETEALLRSKWAPDFVPTPGNQHAGPPKPTKDGTGAEDGDSLVHMRSVAFTAEQWATLVEYVTDLGLDPTPTNLASAIVSALSRTP